MLPDGDKALFKMYVPAYGDFIADSVVQNYLANQQNQPNNIQDLTNEQLYELGEKDISNGAILISTQDRYRTYINWFIKQHPKQNLNLRLSKKKLPTKSLREQLVMILRRFHPWKEDLSKFVLRIEECGIFEAWGTIPLLVDVSMNPKLTKATKRNLDEKLEILTFIPFFTFLGAGCSISLLIFLLEVSGKLIHSKDLHFKCKHKKQRYNFSSAIFVFGIAAVFIPIWHFYGGTSFKPVLSFLRMVAANDRYVYLIQVVGMDLEGRTEIGGVIPLYG